LAFLLYEGSIFQMRATNSSLVFTFSLYASLFIHPHRQKSDLYGPNSNSCISTPIENWTYVYMNLFIGNSPYYHLLKYILSLLKHPVYILYFGLLFIYCILLNACVGRYIHCANVNGMNNKKELEILYSKSGLKL
jgi:hypothetical protein